MDQTINSSAWRIALLAGGDSDEREISLRSGAAVLQALQERGHVVIPIDPAEVDLAGLDWRQFDVAFLALHGRFGEDGQVQQLLDDAAVPYTGSSAAAARLAFSKSAAKERFAQFGVPTAPYVLIHYADDTDRIERMVAQIGYPLVVKPDSQGSSLGVTIVRTPAELPAALRCCFEYDSFGVVEQYISGSEWTIGLLDDRVLPAIRIETPRGFFDYQAKYEDDATEYRFDSDWSSDELLRLEDAARDACRALGTSGLVRVDVMTDHQRLPYVLEVNTIPGLTDHSLVPKAAARVGLPFGELCEQMIGHCLAGRVARPHLLQNPSVRRKSG